MSADPEDLHPPQITVATRLSEYLRGGGIITPFITLVIAFLAGGLVVLITGHDPIATYKAIFDGTGLNWLFPWTSARSSSCTGGSWRSATPAAGCCWSRWRWRRSGRFRIACS